MKIIFTLFLGLFLPLAARALPIEVDPTTPMIAAGDKLQNHALPVPRVHQFE